MELHQLRYVVAVARTGNFSRAAEQCHVAQPSLSQQIQKLEDELGEKLFDRLKREVKLTAHGEAFLRRAVTILNEVEMAQREVSDARQLLRGTIAVGILPTIAPYLLPALMQEFSEAYPGVEVVIQEDTTAQLLKQLLACEIDFAIASNIASDPRIEVRGLFSEELLVALPAQHKLARKRQLAPSDLEQERFIVMKEGHCLGDQVVGFCERRDLRTSVSFRSAQLETIQAMVCAGTGISLIPEMAAKTPGAHRPVFKPLRPSPKRPINALWLKQRPPGRAAQEFLRMLSPQLRS
jgi:LysR family hydrogen peroxide-inducible transcriptional activator